MSSRRLFLKNTLLASFSALAAADGWRRWLLLSEGESPLNHRWPTVIATWDNRQATAAAWGILSAGGRALDAVEAGARVAEADPALAVAHDDQRREAETLAALHGLGDAVDVDELFDQLLAALFGIAATATTLAVATATAAVRSQGSPLRI